jgi:hypothetical protein
MKMRGKESGNHKQSEKEKDEGYLPSYSSKARERRGGQTSDSAVWTGLSVPSKMK